MLKDFGCQGSAVYKSPSKYLSLEFLKQVQGEHYCSFDNNGNLKEYSKVEVDDLIRQKGNSCAEKQEKELIAKELELRQTMSDDLYGVDDSTPEVEKRKPKTKRGDKRMQETNSFMRRKGESESAWCKRTKFYGSKEAMKGMNKMHKDFQRFMGKKNVKTLTEKDLVFVSRKAVL